MRARSKELFYNDKFKFTQYSHPKTGKKYYTIVAFPWGFPTDRQSGFPSVSNEKSIQPMLREHFDLNKNRGAAKGYKWTYSSKAEAEQLLTMALLKWGGQ